MLHSFELLSCSIYQCVTPKIYFVNLWKSPEPLHGIPCFSGFQSALINVIKDTYFGGSGEILFPWAKMFPAGSNWMC